MKTNLLFGLLLLSVFLQGCSLISSQLNVIHPPNLTEKQKQVKHDVQHQLDVDSILIQINSGQHSSKYHFIDLNGDNQQELVVLFYQNNQAPFISIAIFKEESGRYILHQQIPTTYSFPYNIQFVDLNNDGTQEIIATFYYTKQIEDDKRMLIFHLNKEGEYELTEETEFQQYGVIKNDNTHEKYVFLIKTKNNRTIATLSVLNKGNLNVTSNLALPITVADISQISIGAFSPTEYGVCLDVKINNRMVIVPHLILIEDNKLNLKVFPLESLNIKSEFGATHDYDFDDIYEFPVIRQYEYGSWNGKVVPFLAIIDWYQREGAGKYQNEQTIFYNLKDRYLIHIPKEFRKDIHVSYHNKKVLLQNKHTKETYIEIKKIEKEKDFQIDEKFILGTRQNDTFIATKLHPAFQNSFYLMTKF